MPDTIISTTQDHLEIENILQDILILKGSAAAMVLQVSAINFGLLSEEEQDATIYAYAGILNSLSFTLQIVIKSDKKDISAYLELLESQEKKLKSPILKEQMRSYRNFVEETIVEQNVLDKKFYVVIPYQPVTLTTKTTINYEALVKNALTDLEPKRDHLIKLFARIGLVVQQLNGQSLLKLFHHFYNPGVKGQRLASAKDYQAPMVAPNIANPEPQPETPS